MNPYFRTVALIAASLGLVVSLFVALRDDDEETAGTTTTATTTATAPTTTAATTEPPPTTTEPPPTTAPPATTEPPQTTAPPDGVVTIRIAVVGGRPEGGIQRPSVRKDRNVMLRVTSDVADHVHVHGYDLFVDVGPAAPGEISFKADIPGRFEIELEDRHVQIADLEVRP